MTLLTCQAALTGRKAFGDTGFGVSANYTIVDADDIYDNTLTCPAGGIADFCAQGDPIQQFAIEGISVGVLRRGQ